MASPTVAPTYSHGGPGSSGFPTVQGTGVSNGQPISIVNATNDAAVFTLILSGTTGQTLTVFIESNGGPVDATGNPPASDWVDMTGGTGYVMTVGASNAPDVRAKLIPRGKPYWRSRISAYTSGTLVSYCDGVIDATGYIKTAGRPPLSSPSQQTTSNP